jgi:hypothetical protein
MVGRWDGMITESFNTEIRAQNAQRDTEIRSQNAQRTREEHGLVRLLEPKARAKVAVGSAMTVPVFPGVKLKPGKTCGSHYCPRNQGLRIDLAASASMQI